MNDTQIIGGLRAKREEAMNAAMDKYAKLMWHIAGRVLTPLASVEDIEECVADVFVYLWQNHHKYDERRGSLKAWLAVVAKSRAIDRYRRLAKMQVIPLHEEQLVETLGLVDEVVSAEQRQEVLAAIHTLGEPDCEIVLRRYYYGQKPKEIAFVLDLTVKQVENRLYQSKRKLRKQIPSENGGL